MWPERDRFAAGSRSLAWPFPPALIPIWYAWIAWSWWAETREQIVRAVSVASDASVVADPSALASGALLARSLGAISEAACYVLWWKSRGARLPFWRFLSWVIGLSTVDLLGFALRRIAADAPAIPRTVCAILAGPAALDAGDAGGSGVMTAFGSLGVLTLVRVAMTGWTQARATGRAVAGPMIVTLCAWLLTRLTGWWSFDLVRGLSPVR
jgi:hypothetical protein